MSGINFNNESEFINEVSIFNNGEPGIVENVKVRVEVKSPEDEDKKPAYKFIAQDKHGEINEGFFYYESAEDKGFKNYQAQRLIRLAKGVLGDDVEFPVFNTPKEALDNIMKMVAKGCKDKYYRVAVCYGTTRRPDSYLRFRSFGRFIEPMSVEPATLKFDNSDNMVKKAIEPTSEQLLVQQMNQNLPEQPSPSPDEEKSDLPF
jgi:hypothetical protein